MQWNRRGQLLGGLVIGAVLWSGALSGCSSAGTEAAPTTTASSESTEPAATEADETYRTDLVDEWVVEWERYEIMMKTASDSSLPRDQRTALVPALRSKKPRMLFKSQ